MAGAEDLELEKQGENILLEAHMGMLAYWIGHKIVNAAGDRVVDNMERKSSRMESCMLPPSQSSRR